MNIKAAISTFPLILTEGSVIERIRRMSSYKLDDNIANAAMIYDSEGREILRRIYKDYIDIAYKHSLPMIILTPTWRASRERLKKAGLGDKNVNGDNFKFLDSIRSEYGNYSSMIFIGGLIGCANDSYKPEEALPKSEALSFHEYQLNALSKAGVDFLIASTLPALCEATGIAAAMAKCGVPYILSFIIRKDGSLLDGNPMADAMEFIDRTTNPKPMAYMVNCIHPTVLKSAIEVEIYSSEILRERLIGLQANTSRRSPEELEGLEELDTEDAETFASSIYELHERYGLRILGGCCGTDDSHIKAIAKKSMNAWRK